MNNLTNGTLFKNLMTVISGVCTLIVIRITGHLQTITDGLNIHFWKYPSGIYLLSLENADTKQHHSFTLIKK